MTKLQQMMKIIAKEVDNIKYISLRYKYDDNQLEFSIIMKSGDLSGLDIYGDKEISCSKNQAEQILKKFLRQSKSLGFGIIDTLYSDGEYPTIDYMTTVRISNISTIVRDDDTAARSYYEKPYVKIFFNGDAYGYGESWIVITENQCLRKTLLSHKRYDLLLML